MNAKNLLNILLSFLFFVLLINLVSAQEDFTASSLSSVELCPCSNQAYTINVQNTGSVASTYKIFASGEVAEWLVFNPKNFALSPGQKTSFFVFVNSVCNIKGDYNLELFITTGNGLTKVVKQALKFSECYDYSLESGQVVEESDSVSFMQHEDSYFLCKNEQKVIPILIKNKENFENRYSLLLDAPEWAKLNIEKTQLAAKKSGVFLINLDTSDVKGKFNFKLDALSELGKVQRKKNIEVDVRECFVLEIDIEKEKDIICGGEAKSYDIFIKNSGVFKQELNLEIDGPDWADFENTSLLLNPGEEKTTKLKYF